MRTAIFTIGAFLISACASTPYIDARLAPYTNIEQAKGISVILGDLTGTKSVIIDTHVVAQCLDYTFDTVIVVDVTQWYILSDLQRHWVIQHELGHCAYGLEHDERLGTDGCPLSVMYPVVPADKCITSIELVPYRDDTKLNSEN
jgi:hypothetical protein